MGPFEDETKFDAALGAIQQAGERDDEGLALRRTGAECSSTGDRLVDFGKGHKEDVLNEASETSFTFIALKASGAALRQLEELKAALKSVDAFVETRAPESTGNSKKPSAKSRKNPAKRSTKAARSRKSKRPPAVDRA